MSLKTMIFTFGRFNPPTKAHLMLIKKVIDTASELSADYEICVSHTLDNNDNPLPWEYKVRILENLNPFLNVLKDSSLRTPFNILENYGKLGYEKVIFIVGSDRIGQFAAGMTPYASEWGIKDFSLISSGERDGDINGSAYSTISSTNAREHAYDGNYKMFCSQLPDELSNKYKKQIFEKIKESQSVNILTGKKPLPVRKSNI